MRKLSKFLAAASLLCCPALAHAQAAATVETVEEIVVTARLREEIAPSGGKLGERDLYAARGSPVCTPVGESGARVTLTVNADRQLSSPF